MSNKPVYQLSVRQILLLAFASALIAIGATALILTLGQYWHSSDPSGVSFAESAPAGISDPSAVSDEQNSIEVYKSVSPGVATTTSSKGQRN
jgi:hypothetical protein